MHRYACIPQRPLYRTTSNIGAHKPTLTTVHRLETLARKQHSTLRPSHPTPSRTHTAAVRADQGAKGCNQMALAQIRLHGRVWLNVVTAACPCMHESVRASGQQSGEAGRKARGTVRPTPAPACCAERGQNGVSLQLQKGRSVTGWGRPQVKITALTIQADSASHILPQRRPAAARRGLAAARLAAACCGRSSVDCPRDGGDLQRWWGMGHVGTGHRALSAATTAARTDELANPQHAIHSPPALPVAGKSNIALRRVPALTPSTNLVRKMTLALLNMPSFSDTTMNWARNGRQGRPVLVASCMGIWQQR